MTSNHVNSRSATPPAFDGAVFHTEVVQSRQFDSVVIAVGANVPDRQTTQNDMMCGTVVCPAIVDVEAVANRISENKVVQFDKSRISEVKARVASFEGRRVFPIQCRQNDRLAFFALKSVEMKAPLVRARCNQDRRARLCFFDGFHNLVTGVCRDGLRRSRLIEQQNHRASKQDSLRVQSLH